VISQYLRSLKQDGESRRILSWAFYDWANSAYATVVIAGFFPIFFKQYWAGDLSATESTYQLGVANAVASLVIMVFAPLLGAIADRGSARKKFLLFFALMGIVMSGSLFFIAAGDWALAAIIYILATIGFMGGNLFYDSLIVQVVPEKKLDVISALGYGLGYLGGGVIFALMVTMTLWPASFGLVDASEAVRVSFLCVALWWGVFSIPLWLFVKEPVKTDNISMWQCVTGGWQQLRDTLHEIRQLRVVMLFLFSYWLYIDGVDTIVRMAVDYGLSIGFDSNSLIVALLITQFVGFPAAILFGRLGQRYGAKTGIFIAIGVYIGITVWASLIEQEIEFYGLAIMIGLVQGGIQSLSRSLYARLIPPDKSAEFFGFYNMLGKFAAVVGPLMMGWVAVATDSHRLAVLSLLVLFFAGAILLWFVDEKAGQRLKERV